MTVRFFYDIDGLETLNLFDYLGSQYDDDGSWFNENLIVSSEQDIIESSSGEYSYITFGVNEQCNDTSLFI